MRRFERNSSLAYKLEPEDDDIVTEQMDVLEREQTEMEPNVERAATVLRLIQRQPGQLSDPERKPYTKPLLQRAKEYGRSVVSGAKEKEMRDRLVQAHGAERMALLVKFLPQAIAIDATGGDWIRLLRLTLKLGRLVKEIVGKGLDAIEEEVLKDIKAEALQSLKGVCLPMSLTIGSGVDLVLTGLETGTQAVYSAFERKRAFIRIQEHSQQST